MFNNEHAVRLSDQRILTKKSEVGQAKVMRPWSLTWGARLRIAFPREGFGGGGQLLGRALGVSAVVTRYTCAGIAEAFVGCQESMFRQRIAAFTRPGAKAAYIIQHVKFDEAAQMVSTEFRFKAARSPATVGCNAIVKQRVPGSVAQLAAELAQLCLLLRAFFCATERAR